MFMHVCVNMTSKRIKASSRGTNSWKNISHERIMRLIWMCQSTGSKSHQLLSTKFGYYHSQGK